MSEKWERKIGIHSTHNFLSLVFIITLRQKLRDQQKFWIIEFIVKETWLVVYRRNRL